MKQSLVINFAMLIPTNAKYPTDFFPSLAVLLALSFALLETGSMLWTSLVKYLRLADEKLEKWATHGYQ